MAKGFGSQLKTSAISYSQTVKTPQFNSINAIQDNLLSYIEDIQDPRVPRTQKHLFKDVLVIAILAVKSWGKGLGRYGKLWHR
ncbi:MAG: transposase family protein [Coleofasciculus sp. G3-WIS-01]|uniref:transposase family protein n=1 Tax=Coleofasciculus sp. G3-WIS-01 TaxID=3069528 RepID=UPI003303C016